eukprot:Nk52_evm12s319 gene=Nk52_evmTU12s319
MSKKINKYLSAIDPFQETIQNVEDPKEEEKEAEWNSESAPFLVLFCICILAYSVYAFVLFAQRADVEVFELQSSSSHGYQLVNISVECTGTCGTIILGQDYSSVASTVDPFCAKQPAKTDITSLYGVPGAVFQAPLCYLPGSNNYQGVYLDFQDGFTGANSYATVTVKDPYSTMVYSVDVQAWHRKTVVLGLNMDFKEDGNIVYPFSSSQTLTNKELTMQNLQYDGSTTTVSSASNPAVLSFRISQFAVVFVTTRPGSITETFASIGGQASLLLAVFGVLVYLRAYWTKWRVNKKKATSVAGSCSSREDNVEQGAPGEEMQDEEIDVQVTRE